MTNQLFLFISCLVFSLHCISQESHDTCIDVFFRLNSSELDTQQINKIKNFFNRNPLLTQISGFADTTGKPSYNLILSQQRAFTVYDVVKADFDSMNNKMVTFYGESQALSEPWMNRRVQICARSLKPQTITPSKSDSSVVARDTVLKIELENLYFIPDKPVLTQESLPYLEELAKQLKSFPGEFFHIVGHINYQSRFDSTHLRDLFELSRLRAKAVYEYLIEFGIPANRMSYNGVGNSQPVIALPKNDVERRRNMRVQVFVIR